MVVTGECGAETITDNRDNSKTMEHNYSPQHIPYHKSTPLNLIPCTHSPRHNCNYEEEKNQQIMYNTSERFQRLSSVASASYQRQIGCSY